VSDYALFLCIQFLSLLGDWEISSSGGVLAPPAEREEPAQPAGKLAASASWGLGGQTGEADSVRGRGKDKVREGRG
jgi:hypothetical protein